MQRLAARWRPGVHDVRAAHAGGEREGARERLADAHKIRHDAEMIAREELSGAVEARVNLVGDEQDLVRVAQRAEHREKIPRRHHASAAALHRLDEDRADLPLRDRLLDLVVEFFKARRRAVRAFRALGAEILPHPERAAVAVRVGEEGRKLPELCAERLAEKRNASRGERAEAEPVVAARERDHPRLPAVEHRGLQRRLDRLEA